MGSFGVSHGSGDPVGCAKPEEILLADGDWRGGDSSQ